jgi:hypothetical protein
MARQRKSCGLRRAGAVDRSGREAQRHAAVIVRIPRGQRDGSQAREGNVNASEVLGRGRAGCGRMRRRGALGRKNPLPVTQHPEGVCQHTRRLETTPRGALTSEAAYPLQSSSCKGCCHTDRPTTKPWSFIPTANLVDRSCSHMLSRGNHLPLSGFPSVGALWGESVVAAAPSVAGWRSPGPVGDPRRSRARR